MTSLISGIALSALATGPWSAHVIEECRAFDVESAFGARRSTFGVQSTYSANELEEGADDPGLLAAAVIAAVETRPDVETDLSRLFDVGVAVSALHERDPSRTWYVESYEKGVIHWDRVRLLEWPHGFRIRIDGDLVLTSVPNGSLEWSSIGHVEMSVEEVAYWDLPETPDDEWWEVAEADSTIERVALVDGRTRAVVGSSRASVDQYGEETRSYVFERINGRMLPVALLEVFDHGVRLVLVRYESVDIGDPLPVTVPVEVVQLEASLASAPADVRFDPVVTRTSFTWRPRPTSIHDVRLPIDPDAVLRCRSSQLTADERNGFFPGEMASWPQRILDVIRLR